MKGRMNGAKRHRRSLIRQFAGRHRRVPLWLAVVVLVALLAGMTAVFIATGLGADH